MITDTLYHIYINNKCVANNLIETEFKKQYQHIQAYLELTNQIKSANIEYVQCDPPSLLLADGSY